MRPFAILLAAAPLISCSDSLSSIDLLTGELPLAEQPLSSRPSARRVAGIDTVLVAVPLHARLGEPVDVRVPVASGGCRGQDTTVVTVGARDATIVPYQRIATAPNIACSADYYVDRRMVRVTFTARGVARVRIVSRSAADQRLLAVDRPVTVE